MQKNLFDGDQLDIKLQSGIGGNHATRTARTADAIAARATADGTSLAEAEHALYGSSLIGRIVEAEEVAAVITFLASPRSAAINGDAIAAGGGVAGQIHY